MFIYELNQKYLLLALRESGLKKEEEHEGVVMSVTPPLHDHFALVKAVYEVVDPKSITQTYKLFHHKQYWDVLFDQIPGTPVVSHPEIEVHLFKRKKQLFVTKKIWETTDDLNARKNQARPWPHPTTLDPVLAKALLNIASPKKTFLDPMCGAGGILLEACLLGLQTTGIDLYAPMIGRAKENLAHYNCNATLLIKDFREHQGCYDAVVTDLPYGRSSKTSGENLFAELLAKKFANKQIIITNKPFRNLTKDIIEIPMHKSLTRYVHFFV
ncbi:MAG: hypothetical protein H6502_04110 [Candidatus Woesearchaeota archaeon]|nr:MAG: hypothetical protein H6502_04110 [Candidatus Woesearchaeota archaeon]